MPKTKNVYASADPRMKRSDETTPFVNVLQGNWTSRDTTDWLLTSFVIGNHKVQKHQARLGKQNRCENLSVRFWVWETDLWRIYVNNDHGVSLEVPLDSTPKQALEAVADYKKRMGVSQDKIEAMRRKMGLKRWGS